MSDIRDLGPTELAARYANGAAVLADANLAFDDKLWILRRLEHAVLTELSEATADQYPGDRAADRRCEALRAGASEVLQAIRQLDPAAPAGVVKPAIRLGPDGEPIDALAEMRRRRRERATRRLLVFGGVVILFVLFGWIIDGGNAAP